MFSPVIYVVFGCLLIIVLFLYYRRFEGFEDSPSGKLPAVDSNLPSDIPGSSTKSPVVSIPQARDIKATIESLNNFEQSYTKTKKEDLDKQHPILRDLIETTHTNYKDKKDKLQKLLEDSNNIGVSSLTDERMMYDKLNQAFANYPETITEKEKDMKKPEEHTNLVANNPKAITKNDLDVLLQKIEQEIKRIENTKSSSTKEKKNQLENVLKKIQEYIKKLENKSITIEEIPIHKDNIDAFLKSLDSDTKLATLFDPDGIESTQSQGKIQDTKQDTKQDNKQEKESKEASPQGKITVEELKELLKRVKGEIERINALRSVSPTMIAKKTHLEKMATDISEMLEKLERKKITLDEIPIKPDDAVKFMNSIQDEELSNIIKEEPIKPVDAPFVNGMNAVPSNDALQTLLEQSKYLKWNIQVNMQFDPELEQSDKYLTYLKSMEGHFKKLLSENNKIPEEKYNAYLSELHTLRSIVSKRSEQKNIYPEKLAMNLNNDHKTSPHIPSSEELQRIQGGDLNRKATVESFRNEYPDYETMQSNIINRGANASFDTYTVGGLNYKERVKNMCSQIHNIGLTDARELGCIQDQDSVSDSYSWKGNYEMVCSRLKTLWGDWYPEMLGCLKH